MKKTARLAVMGAASAATLLSSTACLASVPGAAGYVNTATAVNVGTGQQFRIALDVNQTGAASVTAVNRAYALTTHCSGCRTAAIAVQIVVLPSDSNITVDNEAKAVEDHSINSSNLASAYEIVVKTPNPTISDSTRRGLEQVRMRLEALRQSGLTGDALQAAVDQLAGQAESVLLAGLAPASGPTTALRAAAPLSGPQIQVYRQVDSQ